MDTYLLPLFLILGYEFLAFGIIMPCIIILGGLLPFLIWFIVNTVPWAAIIYYREELGIKQLLASHSKGFLGENRAAQALNWLVENLPKHKEDED